MFFWLLFPSQKKERKWFFQRDREFSQIINYYIFEGKDFYSIHNTILQSLQLSRWVLIKINSIINSVYIPALPNLLIFDKNSPDFRSWFLRFSPDFYIWLSTAFWTNKRTEKRGVLQCWMNMVASRKLRAPVFWAWAQLGPEKK
jgi:hypothetical protein